MSGPSQPENDDRGPAQNGFFVKPRIWGPRAVFTPIARLGHVKKPRLVALAVLSSLAVVLSGCAIGADAGTSQVRATGNGVDATSELGVGIRSAVLVEGPSTLTLVGTLKNSGTADDVLIGARFGEGLQGLLIPGAVEVPAGGAVSLGLPTSAFRVVVPATTSRPSQYVPMTLVFRNAGEVELSVLVVEPVREYADIKVE